MEVFVLPYGSSIYGGKKFQIKIRVASRELKKNQKLKYAPDSRCLSANIFSSFAAFHVGVFFSILFKSTFLSVRFSVPLAAFACYGLYTLLLCTLFYFRFYCVCGFSISALIQFSRVKYFFVIFFHQE